LGHDLVLRSPVAKGRGFAVALKLT
jgi:hypothetical protein